jgi:transposase
VAHKRKAFSEEQKRTIQQGLREKNSPTDERRLLILQAAEDGELPTEALSKTFRVSLSSITHIITNFRKDGLAGIRSTKLGGNRRNISKEEEKKFLEGYVQQGREGRIIEVSEIWRAYEEKMGRPVSSCAVYGMLHRNGWRKVMPRSRHPKKASPEAIESYKKNGRQNERAYKNISFSFSPHVSRRSGLWTDQ